MALEEKKILEDAANLLEQTLTSKCRGSDENLRFAVRILREAEIIPLSAFTWRGDEGDAVHPIVTAWNEMIHSDITSHCQPTGLTKGTLFVNVDNQPMLNQIVRFHRKEILENLQNKFGGDLIARVSYRFGPILDQVQFNIYLPTDALKHSESVQNPHCFNPPASAQECIRLALAQVLANKPFLLRFIESRPLPDAEQEREIANQCTILGLSDLETKDYRGMRFQSDVEIKICAAFEKSGVLFFPLPIANCAGAQKIPDFLVCFEGKWGVLEVDGESYHTAKSKPREDERDRWFKRHGIRVIEHYAAKVCWNEPEGVINEFLTLLRANG